MATISYIKIDRSKSMGNDLLGAADNIRRLRATLKAHLSFMDNQNDGVDWSHLEAIYGLQPGKGAEVYTILSDSIVKLESANVNKLMATLIPSV